jgi:aminoglycoside phosphotransferase (APT) family kinase protein
LRPPRIRNTLPHLPDSDRRVAVPIHTNDPKGVVPPPQTRPEQDDPVLLRDSLARMRLLAPDEPMVATPLTGGVSSDIWKIESGGRVFAVKRARPQLKVAAEWHVPVERNAYEVKWFRAAGAVVPGAAPDILGEDRAAGLFAMAYLDPATHPVWKDELRAGRIDRAFAAEVGYRLARIHSATAGGEGVAAAFATDATFHAIRLEAYLEATARAHPVVESSLMALSQATLATKKALVHGDVSPKNILVGPDGPVFLDAECAWYGDPAFDLAFCLNHLLLKCLWVPTSAPDFLAAFAALADAHLAGVSWEPPDLFERRAALLLPALLLARADGKSPVEYLDEAGREAVRRTALPLITAPPPRLEDVRRHFARSIGVGETMP